MKTSAVICVRNDGYGLINGYTLEDRASFCINSYINSVDELFLIDWNSPSHPLLWDIKDNIEFKGNLKHIVISPEIASLLTNNDPNAGKCCEVLCRNLGLRRATGDWLISTNIDIICPKKEDIQKFINEKNKNTFYTISRRGVDWEIITKYFKDNNFQRNEKNLNFKEWSSLREYLYKNIPERHYLEAINNGDKYSKINCAGDFQIAYKDIWNNIRGFEEDLIYVLYSDTNVQKKADFYGYGLEAEFSPPLFHINHGLAGAGFMQGINKKTNDIHRAVTFQHESQNPDTWGFSNIEIEYELL